MFIVFFLLILNLAISIWNAHVTGRFWSERRQLPGFVQALMWCGAIMSVAGFFSVYVTVLTMGMYDLGAFEWLALALFKVELEPTDVQSLVQNIFDLSYLVIVFPVLGTGFAIWANSVAVAFVRRDWASIGIAGYNTAAQVHNMVSAVRHVPRATKSLSKGLKIRLKGKSAAGLAYLVLFLLPIIVSLGGAIATTVLIMRASDARYDLEDLAREV